LHPGGQEQHWSAQNLIQHLVLVCRSTSQVLQTRLDRGRPTQGRGTILQRARQLLVLSSGHMPRGTPAPPFGRPGQLSWPPMNGRELLAMLLEEMERMDQLLDECHRRFGAQRAAAHFLLGPMRVDQWRRFHVIHFRHHLQQLSRIEKAIGPAEPMHAQP
jgi:hypothetical protein